MRSLFKLACIGVSVGFISSVLSASPELIQEHCYDCHNDEKTKGKFNLSFLGKGPTSGNLDYWLDVLDYVQAGDMPPEEDSELSDKGRAEIVSYVEQLLSDFDAMHTEIAQVVPRRLNNREFEYSLRDVLLLEDVGTHKPMDNLIGDTLFHGFDTHSSTLGFSYFHLEQYLKSVRNVLDAVILEGDQPETQVHHIPAESIVRRVINQNTRGIKMRGKDGVFEFTDPRSAAYFEDLEFIPYSGRYKLAIRCRAVDRNIYKTEHNTRQKNIVRLTP